MHSPARAHRQEVEAKQAAEIAAEQGTASLQELAPYQQQLAQLNTHKATLSGVQNNITKAGMKREFVKEYDAYLDGVLAADTGVQDNVLVTIMLWNIDAGDYDRALTLADYAVRHELSAPEGFERTLATLVTEEISDAALRNAEDVSSDQLASLHDLVVDADMPTQVTAKMFRAYGESVAESQPEKAVVLLNCALEQNAQAGCKQLRDKLQKQLEQGNE